MVIVATNCMAKYILQDEQNLSNEKQLHVRGLKYAAQYGAKRDLFNKDLFSLRALKSTFISKRSSSPCPAGFSPGSVHTNNLFFNGYFNDNFLNETLYGVYQGNYNGNVCICNLNNGAPAEIPACDASQECSDGSSGSVATSGAYSILVCPSP
jgi:hypothetical protein